MLVEGGLIIEGICKSQLQTCRIEIPDSILEGKNKEEQNNTHGKWANGGTATKLGIGRPRRRENMDIDGNTRDGEKKQAARKDIDAAFTTANQLNDRWAACSPTSFSLSHKHP